MIGAMCTALDVIQYQMTQSRMQMALDVATLSAASDLSRFGTTTGANLATWQADARAYFDANMVAGYLRTNVVRDSFNATVSGTPAAGQTISLSVAGNMQLIAPAISPGSGANATNVAVTANNSAIRVPASQLELVMVLDNTGSMNGSATATPNGPSKMNGLKIAASNLVSLMFAQNMPEYRIGLVPFASTVNVLGALPGNANWLSANFSYNSQNVQMSGDRSAPTYGGWGGCPVEPRTAKGYLYPKAYSPGDAMKFTPYFYNVPPAGLTIRSYSPGNFYLGNGTCGKPSVAVQKSVPVTLNDGQPNLCGYPADTQGTGIGVFYDQYNTTLYGTRVLTQNTDCIATPVTFLTSDEITLQKSIEGMTPSGSTIIPIGLLWGWRMLSSSWSNANSKGSGWISTNPNLPKDEATQGLQRVMILLTDGQNQVGAAGSIPNDLYFNGLSGVGDATLSAPTVYRTDGSSLIDGRMDSAERHGGNPKDASSSGNAGWPDDIDSFQAAVCTSIKETGVTIYTITFGQGASNPTIQLAMQACASAGNYYHAPDNAALNDIFQHIAGRLGQLRLVN